MSTYVIGDVQGCFEPLQQLLTHIVFNPNKDTLWFTGDLVNRGPHSVEVLRFVKQLGPKHGTVLGNHDLHLIALAYGRQPITSSDDTLTNILNAEDKNELIDWLRHQPLLHSLQGFNLVHAGLAASWDITTAQQLASEVEKVLRSDTPEQFLQHMYGNTPDQWRDDLQGSDRLRCITNHFTRLRLCYPDGRMDFDYKGPLMAKPEDLIPWFDVPLRANQKNKIVFGHWAALAGVTDRGNVYALDTGCVWGNTLTAMRLEDGERFSVGCKSRAR